MNRRNYIICSSLFVFGLCICAGCSAQQGEKYTLEELDNLAEIRIYSAENNELIKTISDEEELYQYNQCSIFDDSDIVERQGELEKNLEGAKEQYYLVAYKYPVARFGGKELEENTTITLYEDTCIIKMTVAEESIKAFTIPEEFLTFYYELSEEEINYYHALVEEEHFSNVEEKRQFTEIMTASGEMIGIIDNNKEIERFVKRLDIESWNHMEQLPEDTDLVYSYISYEVIDEPIFLQDGTPLVHMSTLELYISSKGEYIIRDYDQEIETIARISEKAGRFLNAPEDLELNKNITAKAILDGWGLDFYVPDSDIETGQYYEGETSFIESARYYQGETSFTEKELRKTSKEQKIQFYGADKNTLLNEIDDISEIAQYLNGLALDQWEYADDAPNPEEVECQIVRFMLSRDNKKELKEMDTRILYKSDGNYYIEEIIPGEYSDWGEFITHYQVSEETAKYILSYLE